MGFLNPLWLLLGGAVAVPLILHLLQRHQGPRVVFPAVRYLKRAEREHARRIRLRQLLLLLLRVAAVLLIAFGAARPFVRGGGAGHAPTAMVIVLDNSLSSGLVTGDRRVLDELKDHALATLQAAGPDDRFWLLRAGAPWEPALPGDAQTIAARVRETEPTAGAADIVAAVERARSILSQGADGRAREIQLFSDLQRVNVRGALPASASADDDVRILVWSPQRPAITNAAVAGVTVGGGLAPRAGQRSTVVARVGGNARDSVNVRLAVDGRIAAAAIARPGSDAVLPLPARNTSLMTGTVEIDADGLRADDTRYFVAPILPPPSVALARDVPFVAEALSVLADAGRIARTTSPSADVMVARAAAGTESTGPNTAVVILPPQTPLELPALNRRLATLGINWRYAQAPPADLRFANAGAGDELLRGLANVRVLQRFQLTPTTTAAQDSVMLRLEDGSAWAVRGSRARGGRFVLLASPLNVEATTLPASAAMIPLLDRLTGVWSAPDAPRSEVQPGERVTLPRSAELVIDPAGVRHAVAGAATFDFTTVPGVYRVVEDGRMTGAFVVNFAGPESDLRYADRGRVERALAGLTVDFADDARAWSRAMYGRRVGREVWRFVLVGLLVLLLVEALAAATGVRGPGLIFYERPIQP